MTISQLEQLEAVYRDGGQTGYAEQVSELRAKRIADGWSETYVPKVTPRWSSDLQYARSFGINPSYALERAKEETTEMSEAKRSGKWYGYGESQPKDEAATAEREMAAQKKKAAQAEYAREVAEQAEKFAKHLAHV